MTEQPGSMVDRLRAAASLFPKPPSAVQALCELADDIATLRVHAIDSPAYRDGARDALQAVEAMVAAHIKGAAHGAGCAFPGCPRTALHPSTMCGLHATVRVSGSYADDRHTDGGHG